jgi:hypothetical protein
MPPHTPCLLDVVCFRWADSDWATGISRLDWQRSRRDGKRALHHELGTTSILNGTRGRSSGSGSIAVSISPKGVSADDGIIDVAMI